MGGVRSLRLGFALGLVACARPCAIRAAEQDGYGDHTLDCSRGHAKATGQVCNGDLELWAVTGCRLENGEIVSTKVLVDPRSCVGRSPAGACYE